MAVEIRVPVMGESVSEGNISQWLKKPGEMVAVDEPLVEIETDKVAVEVPSPVAGVLVEILAQEGDTVEIDALLATIDETGTASVAQAAPKTDNASSSVSAPKIAEQPGAQETKASPAARKHAADNNIDVANVAGSGRDGRVMKPDVLSAVEKIASGTTPSPAVTPVAQNSASRPEAAREDRVKMTRLRATIAKRLKDAQNTAAILTTFNEVDLGEIMALRSTMKDEFEKRHGARLGFMGFFVKAAIAALREIPAVNAEIEGQEIVYKNYYNIGVAVGTPQGLVVPVLRDADKMTLGDVENTIAAYGRAARDGKLSIADMQGGTFTISNGGVYGSLMSTPIINPPQSAILGMHKIQQRPMAVNGQVEIRPMMYLALSYDHRIIDGKEAVTFLVRMKDMLEDPRRMLLDL
ncbi:MAG: 2-oxoglutarate dehydrogenase complex dihydrolipoyllysine-residue succinyltransferase [Alphaproteobacteria bacterium]|jgi:2-oxoglutarate dehydrogenase E2 component (dihydrolipoamide succinyltransferase)|nr:2-oxoglutarate dehydrogenase complex dihydrolipoyllysine-residue succinyltransferase [Alphaproteobacteria bacterium]